ncbi:MAG: ATP-grasp domain-containing protein [Pseudomonadota bacterium]
MTLTAPTRPERSVATNVSPSLQAYDWDVVLLTQKDFLAANLDEPYICQLQLEEALLLKPLRDAGLRVQRLAWDDPQQDWSRCRALLLRSTWDYFFRFREFSPWLQKAAGQTRLFNSTSLLRWNIDKHYLADLQAAGVAIVDTVFVERGSVTPLATVLRKQGWSEAVFKPVVSGSARLTFRVSAGNAAAMQGKFADCVASESMMVQPFMPSVLSEGELSLIVIDGVCTHAVRKVPKAGDFRVQDDHGGCVFAHVASAEEMAFAERAVAACPESPLYARVDVVRAADGGLRVMELKLIEPELFLRFHSPAALRLAAALSKALK